MPMERNIVLVGMPGAGKSTVGVILAKQASMDFVDTDVVIQNSQGRSLQEIVDTRGHMDLRGIEEEIILGLQVTGCVVATGGSAVYSEPAMSHLGARGTVVFLDVDIETLQARVKDYETRGLAKSAAQTFQDLFDERAPLYRKYADIVISCAHMTQDEAAMEIRGHIAKMEGMEA